jgi:hypothetical protein
MIADRSPTYVWVIMLVLSLLFLAWTSLVFAGGSAILELSLGLAGSSMVAADMDHAALGFLTMAMRKPLWEEAWIGILGIYCALGLRRKDRHAWVLGLFWGIMLVTNAAIQGGYEVVVLKWSGPCLQTYLFLVLGTIAVSGLLASRKGYFQAQPRRAM